MLAVTHILHSVYNPRCVLWFLEPVATQEHMNLAMLPLEQRDYCAHYLIKLMKCKRDNFPNFLACKHERHDWDYCEHQE